MQEQHPSTLEEVISGSAVKSQCRKPLITLNTPCIKRLFATPAIHSNASDACASFSSNLSSVSTSTEIATPSEFERIIAQQNMRYYTWFLIYLWIELKTCLFPVHNTSYFCLVQ